MIKISSDFDHGNIICRDASEPGNIQLEIRPDGKADFYQWFYFRVDGGAQKPLVMHLINAAGGSYPPGWNNYRDVASYDGDSWFRVDTEYDGKALSVSHTPDQDTVYYAYFAAYPAARVIAFNKKIISSGGFHHETLGQTLDDQNIDYFRAGTPINGKKNFWVIARQHPGEDMGSWWMEGFFDKLSIEGDSATQKLLNEAVIHIVPCMNLDGVKRGHLRTNAAGRDLNRAWRNATMEDTPEVFLVREKMQQTGVDFFLDVHGDEAIANNFLDSAEGVPSWSESHQAQFNQYSSLLLRLSKDFQNVEGYPAAAPGEANLDIANKYIAETWNCLSMTLEMPFKDAKVNPNPVHGWSPDRCRNFAKENLQVMAEMASHLK